MVNLIWTDNAIEDLNKIRNYISQDSIKDAKRFIEIIFEKTDKLKQFPRIGRIVPEKNIEFLRELIIRNYRIIYKIKNTSVFILMIVHGNRLLDGNSLSMIW